MLHETTAQKLVAETRRRKSAQARAAAGQEGFCVVRMQAASRKRPASTLHPISDDTHDEALTESLMRRARGKVNKTDASCGLR
jgi:hypothetical protein